MVQILGEEVDMKIGKNKTLMELLELCSGRDGDLCLIDLVDVDLPEASEVVEVDFERLILVMSDYHSGNRAEAENIAKAISQDKDILRYKTKGGRGRYDTSKL